MLIVVCRCTRMFISTGSTAARVQYVHVTRISATTAAALSIR
jgi:hypothetical protein